MRQRFTADISLNCTPLGLTVFYVLCIKHQKKLRWPEDQQVVSMIPPCPSADSRDNLSNLVVTSNSVDDTRTPGQPHLHRHTQIKYYLKIQQILCTPFVHRSINFSTHSKFGLEKNRRVILENYYMYLFRVEFVCCPFACMHAWVSSECFWIHPLTDQRHACDSNLAMDVSM